jgi:hypothetical protein
MKLSVYYSKFTKAKQWQKLKNQKLVYHAVAYPVCKGVWWFHADFKCHFEVAMHGGGTFNRETCFEVLPKDGRYMTLKFDWSKEGKDMDIYGQVSKTSYMGIIIESAMIQKAVNRVDEKHIKAFLKRKSGRNK